MSKSSKRRLAKSLLDAAVQTAASPFSPPQRATGTPAGVPLSLLGLPQPPTNPNSKTPLLDSARASSVLLVPSVPYVLSDALSPALNSDLSNLKSVPAPSTPSLCHSATSPLSPPSALSTHNSALSGPPSEFFKTHLEPHCPPQPGSKTTIHPPIIRDPNDPAGPIDSQFEDYQARLKPVFARLSPDDPSIERLLHNYVITMQIATVERLIHALPGLSEKAMVDTNAQIVRTLAIIERTNSRRARELREKDAAARRQIRDQQRKERQTQKEQESLARNQRTKDREDQRHQREKEKSDRAQQNYQLAMRKLDLKERTLEARTQAAKEKLEHRNSKKSQPTPPKPIGPPNTWTCG